jgi:hypothetical protein
MDVVLLGFGLRKITPFWIYRPALISRPLSSGLARSDFLNFKILIFNFLDKKHLARAVASK